MPFGGRTLVTVSWALFAVNTAIQFPFLIRFGYNRVNILTTILPWMVVAVVIEKRT